MSVYVITNASEQALRLLLKAGGGEETLLLQRPDNTLHAKVQLEPSCSKLVAALRIGDRTESMVLQRDDPANASHIADYLEALANGTAETAKAPEAGAARELAPCRTCGGEALSTDYVNDQDLWVHRISCRYNNCHEVDGYMSLQGAKARWNREQGQPVQAAPEQDMVNHPPHYNSHPSGIECIQVTERLPFNLGNAFKYLFRHKAKNGREDLQKAHWYLQREIERSHECTGGIAIGDLQAANSLARAIAAHEPYPTGAALVAIANNEPAEALTWVKSLLAA